MLHGRSASPASSLLVAAIVVCLSCNAFSVARGQEPPAKPSVGFGVALTSAGGVYSYAADRRGVLHVNVINRQEVPLELLATTYFEDEPTLQYGRKIWVPARSRLQTWHPIQIPSKTSPDGKTVRFQSLFMKAGQDQEVLIRTDSGQMKHDGFLPVVKESTTGMVENMEGLNVVQTEETRDLVVACRAKQNLGRRISTMTDFVFDPGDESLAALDHLVICDSRQTTDASGIAAIRRWLYGGGHLWVLLDQVKPELLDMLMGDSIQCKIVDRVSLTTVNVEPEAAGARATRSSAEFENPVDLVRVQVSDADIAYSVNGWPAAFMKKCGEGQLLVTTLGPRGWMVLRPPGPPQTSNVDIPTKYVPTEPMGHLSSEFIAARKAAPISPAVVEPIVQEYVGYSIPSRGLIIGLLVGFSVLLAGSGVWLWRIGRLELSGVVGPALAVVVSGILLCLGIMQRQAVPTTDASLQFVQAVSGTDDFLAEGQVGIFNSGSGPATLGGTDGGFVMPDMQGLEGTIRRMIWTDLDKWQWQNLPSTTGLRNAKFQKSGELQKRLTAKATFGPTGLTGQLDLPEQYHPSDAMLATVGGRIGVDIQAGGRFTANSADKFSDEQFLSADLLSDEQNRRRQVLLQLLTVPREDQADNVPGFAGPGTLRRLRTDYPDRPTLMFWTEPWDLGFQYSQGSRKLGSALVTVPVKLQRPPTGTEVSIPAPLLLFVQVAGPDGIVPAGLWDPRKREWALKSNPSTTWLKFQVPPVLLPAEALSGRLLVRVTGPMGKLEIAGVKQGKVAPLKTWMDPVGTLDYVIEDKEFLTVGPDGGILLRVAAGDPDRPELTKTVSSAGEKVNFWQIESLTLDLKARTIEAGKKE